MSLDRPPIAEEFQSAADLAPSAISRKPEALSPFSLRLSATEKAELLQQAGNRPLGAYIRSRLLGSGESPRRVSRRPVKDEKVLGQLLAELGRGRLANNLNQLAKAANMGSLAIAPETDQALQQACKDVQWMRTTLITALGLQPGGGP